VVICLEQGADLHMAQLLSLPLTVSCSSKIQIGFTFLVPADPGSPGHRAVKRVCVCVCCDSSGSQAVLKLLQSVFPRSNKSFLVKLSKAYSSHNFTQVVLWHDITNRKNE